MLCGEENEISREKGILTCATFLLPPPSPAQASGIRTFPTRSESHICTHVKAHVHGCTHTYIYIIYVHIEIGNKANICVKMELYSPFYAQSHSTPRKNVSVH